LKCNATALKFIINCVDQLASKRGVLLTEKGYFGSGRPGITSGDTVLLLNGVIVPITVRKSGTTPTKYRAISPAFIPEWVGNDRSELGLEEIVLT